MDNTLPNETLDEKRDHRIKLPNDELVTDEALAVDWHTTTRTLRRYEHEPDGLPYVMVTGRKWRPVKASAEWLARRMRKPNPRRAA